MWRKLLGGTNQKDLPNFEWLNTIIAIIKTGLYGTYHEFDYRYADLWLQKKYGDRRQAEVAYRFNRRFNLKNLPQRLLNTYVAYRPLPNRFHRSA
jgi:hypothetical protein